MFVQTKLSSQDNYWPVETGVKDGPVSVHSAMLK